MMSDTIGAKNDNPPTPASRLRILSFNPTSIGKAKKRRKILTALKKNR